MIPPMPPTFDEMQRESALTRALAFEATHTRCPSCEQWVDGVHSCYDAKLMRQVRAAERAVVEASLDAVALYGTRLDESPVNARSGGYAKWLAARDAWLEAVRALAGLAIPVRGEDGP